jgi:hypothetical protein
MYHVQQCFRFIPLAATTPTNLPTDPSKSPAWTTVMSCIVYTSIMAAVGVAKVGVAVISDDDDHDDGEI